MIFEFSFTNMINQYSLFMIPFLILVLGVLLSKFTIGIRS